MTHDTIAKWLQIKDISMTFTRHKYQHTIDLHPYALTPPRHHSTLLTFTNTEHLLLPNILITFHADYYKKKRISIETYRLNFQIRKLKRSCRNMQH